MWIDFIEIELHFKNYSALSSCAQISRRCCIRTEQMWFLRLKRHLVPFTFFKYAVNQKIISSLNEKNLLFIDYNFIESVCLWFD